LLRWEYGQRCVCNSIRRRLWKRVVSTKPFLLRFLPAMAIWSIATALSAHFSMHTFHNICMCLYKKIA